MSFIKTISYEAAKGKLKKIYDRIIGPNNYLDNVLTVHSLRPHTLNGHMTLYKSVLHHNGNTLPKWYLEALGTYVSFLNQCSYCVDHHAVGLQKNIHDDQKFEAIYQAIKEDTLASVFSDKELAGADYARMLTLEHSSINEGSIYSLREVGYDDGEILEINQVVSYFNYVNRTVVGLGVDTAGDIIGLSPNKGDDENDWGHR